MSSTSAGQPLHIGIDATPLFGQPTGVGAVTNSIVSRLVSEGTIDLTLLLVSWNAKRLLDSQPSGPLGSAVSVRSLRFPARVAHQLWQRVNLPAVGGFDVVHGTNFVVPPAKKSAELVTIHDLTAWHMPELVSSYSAAYPRLIDRAVSRGAHIHVVSQAVADEVVDTIAVDSDRVHVIANGFDLPLADELGQDSDIWADAGRDLVDGQYILCLGTIEPRKDHPSLLAAMKSVWLTHPKVKLVVAGRDGWGVEAYDRAMHDLGLVDDGRIVRMGYVTNEDRLALLAGADCLAYPSLYEGFGLPPLEAMAVSTPVVATDIAAVAEVCGDAAILVPTRDPDALAEGLITVLEGGGDRLVPLGHLRTQNYDWDRSVAELVVLYERLAKSR